MHWLACIWYLMINNKGAWVPPKDTGKESPDESFPWMRSDFYESSNFKKYITLFYYAVLAVVGNDLCPRGTAQTFVSTIFILIGAITCAFIFGNMAALMN